MVEPPTNPKSPATFCTCKKVNESALYSDAVLKDYNIILVRIGNHN